MFLQSIFFGLCMWTTIAAASPSTDPIAPPITDPAKRDYITKKWHNFIRKFPQLANLTAPEADKRFAIFQRNLLAIGQHNQLFRSGQVTFEQQIGPFGHLEPAEFLEQHSIFNIYSAEMPSSDNRTELIQEPEADSSPPHRVTRDALPSEVNWVSKGAVTAVLNQAQCGSCWAFGVAGVMEAWHWRQTGQLVALSAQQLLDCTGGVNSCAGGWPAQAFEYARLNYGLSPASVYPYRAVKGYCYNLWRAAAVKSYAVTVASSEQDLMRAVALWGPVSAGFQIYLSTFQFYKGGVYREPRCTLGTINHVMLVVGYGWDAATSEYYWLAKNTWGTEWGEAGYIRVIRYATGTENCNIAAQGIYQTS